jgi:hypothetical protein
MKGECERLRSAMKEIREHQKKFGVIPTDVRRKMILLYNGGFTGSLEKARKLCALVVDEEDRLLKEHLIKKLLGKARKAKSVKQVAELYCCVALEIENFRKKALDTASRNG